MESIFSRRQYRHLLIKTSWKLCLSPHTQCVTKILVLFMVHLAATEIIKYKHHQSTCLTSGNSEKHWNLFLIAVGNLGSS